MWMWMLECLAQSFERTSLQRTSLQWERTKSIWLQMRKENKDKIFRLFIVIFGAGLLDFGLDCERNWERKFKWKSKAVSIRLKSM